MPQMVTIHAKRVSDMTDASYQDAVISQRHVNFLRESAYPGPHKRKRISSEWGVSEALARQWLEGKIPSSKYLVRMIAKWGRSYVGFVWEPCGQWAREMLMDDGLDRAAAQLETLQKQLEELRRP